ncbi:MAG: hypothetical protein V3T70_01545, partial [Phycisphaerae bacterium]
GANMTASRLALKTERRLRVISEQAYLSVDYQRKTGIAVVKDANLNILQLAAERNLDDLSEMKAEDFGKMLKVEPLQVDDVDPLRAELQAFLDSLRHGTRPAVSAADGLAAMELGERIVASVKAHHWDGATATIR